MNTSKNIFYKRGFEILVPIDFSNDAANGLSMAIQLAKIGDGRITLFHVTSELEQMIEKYYDGFSEISEAYEQGKKKIADDRDKTAWELEKFAIRHDIGEIAIRTVVAVGDFKDEMERYLDQNPASIIVMGSSDKNTPIELFFNNKAEQAIRLSPIPVLVVKEKCEEIFLNKILLGVELKDYDDAAVNAIRTFADYLSAKVLITYVRHSTFEIPDEILRKLSDFALKHHFKNFEVHVLPTGETTGKLEEFAKKNGADVIAMITKGDKGFFKLIYGSSTDQLVEKSSKSILAINE